MSHLLLTEKSFQKAFAIDVTNSAVWESGGLPCSGCCSSPENHCPSLSLWDLVFVSLTSYSTHTHKHTLSFSAFHS